MPRVTFEELSREQHRKLFVVDGHLDDPPELQNDLDVVFLNQETAIMTEMNTPLRKRFKHCVYRVGGFSDIRVVWPVKWPAPAPNRYGWLPKLEFGSPENGPYYNQIDPGLAGVSMEPFPYRAHDGKEVTGIGPA